MAFELIANMQPMRKDSLSVMYNSVKFSNLADATVPVSVYCPKIIVMKINLLLLHSASCFLSHLFCAQHSS